MIREAELELDMYASMMGGRNNCNMPLSELRLVNDEIYVPMHIYEDTLIDTDLEELGTMTDKFVIYDICMFEDIRICRLNGYRACLWYEHCDKIPTAKSILYKPKNKEDTTNFIRENIEKYPFIRTCHMSPKDINTKPLFYDVNDAIETLSVSARTCNIFSDDNSICKHIFMREKRDFKWECRCFWYRRKLRAVSMDTELTTNDKGNISSFFDDYGANIIYNTAIVDLGMTNEGNLELIEFNTFGPDMNATSGHFDWVEDYYDILNADVPIYRGPGEWSFT